MPLLSTPPARFPLTGEAVLPPGAVFPASGGLFRLRTVIPRGMVAIPDARVALPVLRVANPRRAVSIPAAMVAIPSGAVSIPDEMVSNPRGRVALPPRWVSIPRQMVSLPHGAVFIPRARPATPRAAVSPRFCRPLNPAPRLHELGQRSMGQRHLGPVVHSSRHDGCGMAVARAGLSGATAGFRHKTFPAGQPDLRGRTACPFPVALTRPVRSPKPSNFAGFDH